MAPTPEEKSAHDEKPTSDKYATQSPGLLRVIIAHEGPTTAAHFRSALKAQFPSEASLQTQQWDLDAGALFNISIPNRLHTCMKDVHTEGLLVVVPFGQPGQEDGDVMEASKLLTKEAASAGLRYLFVFPEDLRACVNGRPLVSPFLDKDFMDQLKEHQASSVAVCPCHLAKGQHDLPLRLVTNLTALSIVGVSGWPRLLAF